MSCARARKPLDNRPLDLAGDPLDGLEVAGSRDRKARLDGVDPEAGQLVGDLELLRDIERDPGRLSAVAQRGVVDLDAFHAPLRGGRAARDARDHHVARAGDRVLGPLYENAVAQRNAPSPHGV
jgi:hypothetical protein